MRKNLWVSICVLFCLPAFAQPKINVESLLVPAPVSIVGGNGFFPINASTKINVATPDTAARRVGEFLAEKLRETTGFPITLAAHLTKIANGSL